MESVVEVRNAVGLKKIIKFVSVRASQVASKSSNISDSQVDMGDEQKQEELNTDVQEYTEELASEPENDQEDW